MVNLRNSLVRRNHKERAQPLGRARLGLLEKHKDYVHRARDYKSKQDRIRKLKEKAAFRNKDEFYWGMVKGKTKGGVAIADRGNEALSTDVVKILKTQDVGYVKVQIAQDEKKIANLREELESSAPVAGPSSEWTAASELAEVEKLAEMGIIIRPQSSVPAGKGKGKGKGKALPNGHVVFVDGREELSPPVEEEEAAADLGWVLPAQVSKRKKSKKVELVPEVADEEGLLSEAREHRMTLLTELSALLSRLKLLRQAESRLEVTKNLMGKGGARKIKEAGWVEDDSQKEDRNGERRRFEGKVWKFSAERRR
ncbi:U3 small nucleolar RNA-associated protein 11, partial [Tremellales sp. Uapishka_1]